jgi:hypothetical protein
VAQRVVVAEKALRRVSRHVAFEVAHADHDQAVTGTRVDVP